MSNKYLNNVSNVLLILVIVFNILQEYPLLDVIKQGYLFNFIIESILVFGMLRGSFKSGALHAQTIFFLLFCLIILNMVCVLFDLYLFSNYINMIIVLCGCILLFVLIKINDIKQKGFKEIVNKKGVYFAVRPPKNVLELIVSFLGIGAGSMKILVIDDDKDEVFGFKKESGILEKTTIEKYKRNRVLQGYKYKILTTNVDFFKFIISHEKVEGKKYNIIKSNCSSVWRGVLKNLGKEVSIFPSVTVKQ